MAKTTKKARNPGVTRAIFYFSHKNDPLRFPTITEFRGKQLSRPALIASSCVNPVITARRLIPRNLCSTCIRPSARLRCHHFSSTTVTPASPSP